MSMFSGCSMKVKIRKICTENGDRVKFIFVPMTVELNRNSLIYVYLFFVEEDYWLFCSITVWKTCDIECT